MGKRNGLLLLIVAAFLLLGISAGRAEEPSNDALEIDSADVLKFLGAHAWKWTCHPATHYKELTVRLVHYTRDAKGEFQREQFFVDTVEFGDWHVSDDLLIVFSRKDDHLAYMVSNYHSTSGLLENPKIKADEYDRFGDGKGGVPRAFGSELVLTAEFPKNRPFTEKKDEMLSYVAVEIETK